MLELARGYETPYGLELLASVHWISREDPVGSADDIDRLVDQVREWTPRKGRMFTEKHIRSALEAP